MILSGILQNIKTGETSCPYCKGVGIVLDEMLPGSRSGSLGLCSCVTEHCVKCPAKAKAPYLVYEESLNKMIPCFCQEARLTRNKLNKIIDTSNIPPRYKYKFLNSMDVSGSNMMSALAAHDWARELIHHWNDAAYWKKKNEPKQGMYLSGGTGSGKTLLACIILNELIFRYGVKCRYAKISKDFLNALRDTYQKDSEYHGQERSIEMEFADIDVLVIDDFGVQKDSDWVNTKLYDLIDSRYEREKITLLTSNAPLSDWKEKGEGRVYSRLSEMTQEISLVCPDYRVTKTFSNSLDKSTNSAKAKALISIGSNRGDRMKYINSAIIEIQLNSSNRKISVSKIIETKEFELTDQLDSLYCILKIETSLKPLELLDLVQQIEIKLGRIKRYDKSPREIDLDILSYDDLVMANERLTLPHHSIETKFFINELMVDLLHK